MLVRWCADVVSMLRVFGADVVSFGAQDVAFGMPVVPFRHLGGPSSDPGSLGSTRRETLGVRA